MRMTAKFHAARQLAAQIGRHDLLECKAKALYAALNAAGYAWQSGQGAWRALHKARNGKSLFEGENGASSGYFTLRIMAHPDDIERVIAALERAGLELSEQSDFYLNRKGTGCRVYIIGRLDQ